MSMIERVARAIATSDFDGDNIWDDLSSGHKTSYMYNARSAIEAMREKTDRMADDGYRAIHYGADAVWQAMIDAALSE